MPLIIRAIIALAGLGVAIGAGVGAVRGARAMKKWLESGHNVAFIGRPATGKSTMVHILVHADVPKSAPAPTVNAEPVEITLPSGLVVTVIDSGGDRLGQQHQAVDRSSRVVYFFDASRLAADDPDTLSALEADADHIRTLFQKAKHSRRFTLVGTHADLMDAEALASLKRHRTIQTLRQAAGAGSDDVVIGSLATKKAAVELSAQMATSQMRKP